MSKSIKKCGCRSQIKKDCITLLNCNMAYIGVTKLGDLDNDPYIGVTLEATSFIPF
jgi:hypothetical protein